MTWGEFKKSVDEALKKRNIADDEIEIDFIDVVMPNVSVDVEVTQGSDGRLEMTVED